VQGNHNKRMKEGICYFRSLKHKNVGTHIYVVCVVADIFHTQMKPTVYQLSQCVDCLAGSLKERYNVSGIRRQYEDRER
jgi:hypothetical protein